MAEASLCCSRSASDLPLPSSIRCLSVAGDDSAGVRERLAIGRTDIRDVVLRLRSEAGIRRVVVLSTCNRLECYVDGPLAPKASDPLIAWLAGRAGVAATDIAGVASILEGEWAVRHLMRVACGLDSPLLGEAEILAQVASAAHASVAAHAVTPALKRVFRAAVVSGERARRDVWRAFPRVDIGEAAVAATLGPRAEGDAGHVIPASTLVLGAGQVATLALRALRRRGHRATVASRRDRAARELAERHDAGWRAWGDLPSALDEAQALIVGTAARGLVIDARSVAESLRRRPRTLCIVDAGSPPNVDPAVAALDGVTLVDLRDLHALELGSRAARERAIPAVERIVEESVAALRADAPVRPPDAARLTVRLGTRTSALARRQAEEVASLLRRRWVALTVHIVGVEASGDLDLATPFTALAPDAFSDRLEDALLEGSIDVAVHSFKDLPRESREGLAIVAIPVRADPREALVSRDGRGLRALPAGAIIGTSSDRRTATLRRLRPDCRAVPIRGPVDDRLRQVERGDFDAALFAVAGLQRLGLGDRITEVLDEREFPPAAGQGALAVQCRADDHAVRALLMAIDDARLHATVLAECG